MSPSEPILRSTVRVIAYAAVSLLLAGPAHAASTFALPDPSGITLFSLGVAGVLIGRRAANKRQD